MVKDVKTANENDSLQQVCRVMDANKIGSIVIIAGTNKSNKNIPARIITERDAVRHIVMIDVVERKLPLAQSIMNHPLTTISPNSSLPI